MKSEIPISKIITHIVISIAAGIMAITIPAASALADDEVPSIDMGTFENVEQPTDDWIQEGWGYEYDDEYVILKKYTGTDHIVEVPGKVMISGKTYKVKICNETFSNNTDIEEVDFKESDGQNVTVYGELREAFAGDINLHTVDLTGFDSTEVTDYTDIFKTNRDSQITIKGGEDYFMKEVSPHLKEQNRYLGTVKVTAKVKPTGKAISTDQFKFSLYNGSVNEDNLITTVGNADDGSIDFGSIRIRDITKPIKLIAVCEEDGNKNKASRLKVISKIELNPDGTLSIASE